MAAVIVFQSLCDTFGRTLYWKRKGYCTASPSKTIDKRRRSEDSSLYIKYTGWKVSGLYGLAHAVENSGEISEIFPVADVYYFAIKIFQEFCQFLFSAFDYISDFHLIKRADYSTTCDTLNQAEFLPAFCCDVNSLKLVIFTRWAL